MNRSEKHCPGCGEDKPIAAFRKDAGKPDKMDSYCKLCRSKQTKANRPREAARWAKRRKALAVDGKLPSVKPKDHVNARQAARRAHPEPKRCIMRGCTNRGERHHPDTTYARETWTLTIPLCRAHHAKQHTLERARKRTGPSYL